MPDDAELIKAGMEGAVGGFIAPFSDLLKRLLGPGADEAGLALKDEIRFLRMKRGKRLMEQARLIFGAAGKEPERVELKLLLPILEQGSVEEDDDLQDRWAAMLVNSSGQNVLIPGAPDILRQLTPYEVLLLQMCFDVVRVVVRPPSLDLDKKPVNEIIIQWYGVLIEKHNFKRSGMAHHHDQAVMMENLMRLGLLRRGAGGAESIYMTPFGFEFISLCQTHLSR